MANTVSVRGKLLSNKKITQRGDGRKTVKLKANINSKIRIKKV
jgi:hypothetical protein